MENHLHPLPYLICHERVSSTTSSTVLSNFFSGEVPLRLSGGGCNNGIVEVEYLDVWGTVCYNTQWDDYNTNVVCRKLGLPGAGFVVPPGSGAFSTTALITGSWAWPNNKGPQEEI